MVVLMLQVGRQVKATAVSCLWPAKTGQTEKILQHDQLGASATISTDHTGTLIELLPCSR